MASRAGQVIKGGPWNGFKVIDVYTRAQAIEDGVLMDISEWAREYGIVFPVAVNDSVWALIADPNGMKCAGQSIRGRGLDVVAMLALYIRRSQGGSVIHFPVIFATGISRRGNEIRGTYWLKAVCGPGDESEPVITITLPNED
jgi:hypothetical protein